MKKKLITGYDGSKHASPSNLASKNKIKGHKKEIIYARMVQGQKLKGTGKTDVIEPNGDKSSIKSAEKHIQFLLQSKKKSIEHFGDSHFISEFIKSGYKVKKSKFENNNKFDPKDKLVWMKKAEKLSAWIKDRNNFLELLKYIITKNDEITHIVDFYSNDDFALKYNAKEVITFLSKLDIETYVTDGCKVVVASKIPKLSGNKSLGILNIELRGSVGKIGSVNYWTDAQRFYGIMKNNIKAEQIT